ncbi:MAG TPA: DUF167 domain-containing protein [Terriglobia bacterium]|nr:DUF167 domain-containing protein [Terriglobia bacterium]
MSEFSAEGNTVKFWLRVKPRSRHERLGWNAAGELMLEIQAPPVEGKANQAAVEFLAESLRLPRSAVEIVAGEKSRRKLVRITGAPAKETIAKLDALAQRRKP